MFFFFWGGGRASASACLEIDSDLSLEAAQEMRAPKTRAIDEQRGLHLFAKSQIRHILEAHVWCFFFSGS